MDTLHNNCRFCGKNITFSLGCLCDQAKADRKQTEEVCLNVIKSYQGHLTEAKQWLISQGYQPHLPSKMLDFDTNEYIENYEEKLQLWINQHNENSIEIVELVKFLQTKIK